MTTAIVPRVSGGRQEHGHLEEFRTDPIGLMRRVRDERGQPQRYGDSDAAKSDFIAAARRAAQAAAAEADMMKRNPELGGAPRNVNIG